MSYRILTKNAVENTNIDGARDHNFNAGRRSGIVKGALNSGNLFLSANNTIALDTCELRLCGHRVVIDSAEYKTFYNQPSVPIRYSLVAQIIVSNNGESVSFDLKTQLSTIPLVQNDLDKNINGTYELEIGRFTQLTDGTLTDVVRTADLITGGGNNDSEYIRIGTVTTNKISPELDADVDIENTINPDDNKPQTNFTFNLPTSVGTVVSVNGEEKTSINTDTTPVASSENLITSGGVHDYPAVTFAESERQKSKNLFDYTKTYGYSASSSNNDGSYNINVENFYYPEMKYKLETKIGQTYSFSAYINSLTSTESSVYFSARFVYTDGTEGENKTQALIGQRVSFVLTPSKEVDYIIFRLLRTNVKATTSGVVSDIQIEPLQATDYQPYNGAIVHEKEIADVEHIETIYDSNSTDSNKNWGLTGGILGGSDKITGKDFSKYSKLIIYARFNITLGTCEVDLNRIALGSPLGYRFGVIVSAENVESTAFYYCRGIIDDNKTSIHNYDIGYISQGTTVNNRNNNSGYIIYKIEGVY